MRPASRGPHFTTAGIDVDYNAHVLYFVETAARNLYAVGYDGSGMRTVASFSAPYFTQVCGARVCLRLALGTCGCQWAPVWPTSVYQCVPVCTSVYQCVPVCVCHCLPVRLRVAACVIVVERLCVCVPVSVLTCPARQPLSCLLACEVVADAHFPRVG